MPICLAYLKDDKYCTQVDKPFDDSSIMDLLAEIAKVNGNSYSGCWDVVSRKGDDILFAESKRTRKDSIRQSQQNWFASALRCGLKKENFLMVQWDFQP